MTKDGRVKTVKGPGKLHEALIKTVARKHGLSTRGFAKACREALAETDALEAVEDYLNFVPDAYRINREDQTIDMFEVEVSHALSAEKRHKYGMLWFALDSEISEGPEWEARLFIVSRYGHINELPLADEYLRYLATFGDDEDGALASVGLLPNAPARVQSF